MFLEDNIVGDQAYAPRLFDAIRELHIHWEGQASISFVRNEKLLAQAAASGCRGLFVGLESKSMRTLEDTEMAIHRIQDSGILLHTSMVFGFDDDDPSVFDETVEFLQRVRVQSATSNVLTSYLGTEIYDQLKTENRLLTRDWTYYDHWTPVCVPRRMTVDQLYDGYRHAKKSISSTAKIVQRFPANRRTPLLFIPANLGLKLSLGAERPMMLERNAGIRLVPPAGQMT